MVLCNRVCHYHKYQWCSILKTQMGSSASPDFSFKIQGGYFCSKAWINVGNLPELEGMVDTSSSSFPPLSFSSSIPLPFFPFFSSFSSSFFFLLCFVLIEAAQEVFPLYLTCFLDHMLFSKLTISKRKSYLIKGNILIDCHTLTKDSGSHCQ